MWCVLNILSHFFYDCYDVTGQFCSEMSVCAAKEETTSFVIYILSKILQKNLSQSLQGLGTWVLFLEFLKVSQMTKLS